MQHIDTDGIMPRRNQFVLAGLAIAFALMATSPAVAGRQVHGGDVDATAFTTVVREIPNRSAICFFGTPSAASRLINAQSSKVITLQSSSVHFSSVATVQFSSVVDTLAEP